MITGLVDTTVTGQNSTTVGDSFTVEPATAACIATLAGARVTAGQRKNRTDLIGRTNGWKAIPDTLTVHYGDWIADHIR
ncbi:MAG: hypothetical protein OXF65_07755 [Acidimicrobiaceae bacterium]|nr:hypothetical protein [Acidimicrobiaceae bacterium]